MQGRPTINGVQIMRATSNNNAQNYARAFIAQLRDPSSLVTMSLVPIALDDDNDD